MSSRPLIIAIDGPSGAGKGTVARTLAARLDYRHIDTGAMYRAVAWKAQQEGRDLASDRDVADVAERAVFDLSGKIAIDGHDVTRAIRTPEMDAAAASVARHPTVRAILVRRQRAYGDQGGVVMEGRDIGSVVFPDADIKLYLDASPEERARRRAGDAAHAASQTAAVESIAEALHARDHSDRNRTASPLTLAPGAIYIDTTGIPIDDVVAQVMAIVSARL
jgi:cytidylate kinase